VLLAVGAMPVAAEIWARRFPTGAEETRIPKEFVLKVDPDWGTAAITDPNLAVLTDTMQGSFDWPSKAHRNVSWRTPLMQMDLGFDKRSLAYTCNLVLFAAGSAVLSNAIMGNCTNFVDANGRAEGTCTVAR